jgi:KaiC/GvpD/RAD55 family RecA-like ATPase
MRFVHEIGEDRKLYLVLSPAAAMKQTNVGIVREITAEGATAVIITTNQPYPVLRKLYVQEGIDLARVRFIDAITKYAVGKVPDDAENVIFVKSPEDLTDMGIAIAQTLTSVREEEVFILFDSVSTMLIYLSSANISRFIHFVTSRLKIAGIAGVFLAVEKGLDPLLLSQLTTFVDEVVDMEGKG